MEHKIQPLIPGNIEGLEEIARQLLEGVPPEPAAEEGEEEKSTNISNAFNLEDYVFLKGRSHGNYSYPNLIVSMYRLPNVPDVEQTAKKLGFNTANSAEENNGRSFIGNINWQQGIKLNLGLGGRTLSPRQYADFLGLLKSGNAVDGNGRKIPKKKLTEVFSEIIQVRDPYRAEWLDADFKYSSGKLWIHSNHRLVNGNLDAGYKKELESCLMKDRTPGIDLDYWIKNATMQGLPPINNPNGKLYYWCPDKDNNSVARFDADSGRAYLDCCRGPSYTDSSLGVRHVREARAKK